MAQLVELDRLEILVIVDNELDPLSPCTNDFVNQSGGVMDIAMRPSNRLPSEDEGTVHQELRMDNICCSAHGLSLMITGVKNGHRRTVLFDAGPEGEAWGRNAVRLRAEVGDIEVVALSHWHRDHSGGIPRALEMIMTDHEKNQIHSPPLVDVHHDRPDRRGIQIPGLPIISLEADPTFAELENLQGVVDKRSHPHTILDDTFLISGEIPRITEYERGMKFGVQLDAKEGRWVADEEIMDKRILVCKLKNKGLVMFTGCGHAGLINSSKYAIDLGMGSQLYAVIGGFHLATAQPEVVEQTVNDLKDLGVRVVLAGHCTGWRAKFELHRQLPGGFSPCSVGSRFVL